MSELNSRQRRLFAFYNYKNAPLFGPRDYALIYPTPDSIILSDENETIASVLLGDYFDRKLRSFVILSWFPGLLCQLACFPVGFMIFIGSFKSYMAFLTIPGALFPILLLLRSHWKVTVVLMSRWESIFLTGSSLIFCICCTSLLDTDFRSVFIWAVIFPALLASTYADASAVRLDSAFLRGDLNIAALTVPPYIIALAYVFSIVGLINTSTFTNQGNGATMHLSSSIVQSSVNYVYMASSTGITISLFIVKSLVLIFIDPFRCISLDAAMIIDIVTLDKSIEKMGSPKKDFLLDDGLNNTLGRSPDVIIGAKNEEIEIGHKSGSVLAGETSLKDITDSYIDTGIRGGKSLPFSLGDCQQSADFEDSIEKWDEENGVDGAMGRDSCDRKKGLSNKDDNGNFDDNEDMILEAAFHLKGAIGLIPVRNNINREPFFGNLCNRTARYSLCDFFRRSHRIDITTAGSAQVPDCLFEANNGGSLQCSKGDYCNHDRDSVETLKSERGGLEIASARLTVGSRRTFYNGHRLPCGSVMPSRTSKQSLCDQDNCKDPSDVVSFKIIPEHSTSNRAFHIGEEIELRNLVTLKTATSKIHFRESFSHPKCKTPVDTRSRSPLSASFSHFTSRTPQKILSKTDFINEASRDQPAREMCRVDLDTCESGFHQSLPKISGYVPEEKGNSLERSGMLGSFNLTAQEHPSDGFFIGNSKDSSGTFHCHRHEACNESTVHHQFKARGDTESDFQTKTYYGSDRNPDSTNDIIGPTILPCNTSMQSFITKNNVPVNVQLTETNSSSTLNIVTSVEAHSDEGRKSDGDNTAESRDPSHTPTSAVPLRSSFTSKLSPSYQTPSMRPDSAVMSSLTERQVRLSPFYSKANAVLFGPDDYSLLSPAPTSILISDECETVAFALFGGYFDIKLREFAAYFWYPAFIFQLSCLPVGLLILLGGLPTKGVYFTAPGAIFPIMVLLQCHWKVFKALLFNWEQLFLSIYSFVFCFCISLMTAKLPRTVYIWLVIFPSLISSVFSDASATRLDYSFLNKSQQTPILKDVCMCTLPPYVASLGYIFSIVALLNLKFDIQLNTFASFQIDTSILRTNVNYSVTASNVGLTISVFLIKCLILLIVNPRRCVSLRAPMNVHIAILEPQPLSTDTEKTPGHYVLEAKFAIQRGGVVVQQTGNNDKMKGEKAEENASKCDNNNTAGDNKLPVTKKIYFRSTEEIQEKQRIMGKRNNEIIWSPKKDIGKVPLEAKNMKWNVPDRKMEQILV